MREGEETDRDGRAGTEQEKDDSRRKRRSEDAHKISGNRWRTTVCFGGVLIREQ